MESISTIEVHKPNMYRLVFGLSIFTILYNLGEGVLSMLFGFEDEILTLFGFGVDSFIEVISGFGIAHMVLRMQMRPDGDRDPFEKTALRITGVSFYILVGVLTIMSIYNIWTGHTPITTRWGIIISIISITVMWALVVAKTKVGRQLNSAAILADASCTRVCIYMSIVLLAASAIYELTGLIYIDSIGTLGLAYFSFKEGKECFEKANSNKHCCCENG
jgi:predicted Co/Zn/Cd cation transporter (cation efflux family)